jgi:hypothetical protein
MGPAVDVGIYGIYRHLALSNRPTGIFDFIQAIRRLIRPS